MKMRRYVCSGVVAALVVALIAPGSFAGEEGSKADRKRAKIDAVAEEAMHILFENDPKARTLYNKAFAYAVFDNLKLSLGISGGGGTGVAVRRSDESRTYMKMGTVGLNIGLGGQKYRVVFLFEDEATFKIFVEKGWEADASANAVVWKTGANAEATFRNGLAIYQLTGTGLMLQADIAGTKYWVSKKLNR